MKIGSVKRELTFKHFTPHDVYEALLDETRFASWSGKPASISREIGGLVSVYDGHVLATNCELVTDEKIVPVKFAAVDASSSYPVVLFTSVQLTAIVLI